MIATLAVLLSGCAITAAEERVTRLSGTLEPRWWAGAPGFGEYPTDPVVTALVVRLDVPFEGESLVGYSSRDVAEMVPDAAAAACMYGQAVVEGVYTPADSAFLPSVLTRARVVSCTPDAAVPELRVGEPATLRGTLRRHWWYGSPGFGADPAVDRMNHGMVLLVDGKRLPLDLDRDVKQLERSRRAGFACDGQTVTFAGTVEASRNPKANPPIKLNDARVVAGCASPAIDQGRSLPPKPMPPEWLQ